MPPMKIAQPYEVSKNGPMPIVPIRWKRISQPVMNVIIAPQRNHQSARFSRPPATIPVRTGASTVAKNGTCTKLK